MRQNVDKIEIPEERHKVTGLQCSLRVNVHSYFQPAGYIVESLTQTLN